MPIPTYVTKSRHGVYYLRLTLPRDALRANPGLPKELRRSLRTRNRREAAIRAKVISVDWLQYLQSLYCCMDKNPAAPGQFIVEKGPDGSTRFQFEAHDTPDQVTQYLNLLVAAGQLTPQQAGDPFVRVQHSNPSSAEIQDAKEKAAVASAGGPWLSEAANLFHTAQVEEGAWSRTKTWTGTYEPILRIFREIISREKREIITADGNKATIFDIRTWDIGDDDILSFVKSMWAFPTNWGSKEESQGASAKDAPKLGLPAQSRVNAFKKIRMVQTFLRWCISKRYVSRDILDMFPKDRSKPKGNKKKRGYQPFAQRELESIFGRLDSPTSSIGRP